MITSKHSYIGNRKCVKYSGAHKELRAMLNVGDIVTLLRQNGDKSESIKITGTVRWLGRNIVTVNVMGDESANGSRLRGSRFMFAEDPFGRPQLGMGRRRKRRALDGSRAIPLNNSPVGIWRQTQQWLP